MAISLKPQHLNRYRQIAWLFMKYGRSDLVKDSGLEGTLAAEQRVTPKEAAKADELADDLEKLGPTFVKLGQLLSTRVELLPQAYLDALARLQDKVEPFPFDEVEKIVVQRHNLLHKLHVLHQAYKVIGEQLDCRDSSDSARI